jgi:hypothetical protein
LVSCIFPAPIPEHCVKLGIVQAEHIIPEFFNLVPAFLSDFSDFGDRIIPAQEGEDFMAVIVGHDEPFPVPAIFPEDLAGVPLVGYFRDASYGCLLFQEPDSLFQVVLGIPGVAAGFANLGEHLFKQPLFKTLGLGQTAVDYQPEYVAFIDDSDFLLPS